MADTEPGSRDDTDDLLDPAEEAALRGEDGPTLVKGDDDALDIEIPDEEEGEDEDEAAAEDDATDDDPAADEAAAEEPEAAAPAAAAEDDDDPVLPPAPAEFTDADSQRQTAIAAEKDKLFSEFDEGNLTAAEFKEKLGALETEDRSLSAKLGDWQKYEEATDKAWDAASSKWLEAHPEVVALPAEQLGAFDRLMRAYTRSGLGEGLTVKQQHDRVLAEFRVRFPDALPAPAKPAPKVDKRHPADKKRAETPPEKVPSLAQMPAVEGEDASDGEFARLDRLMDKDFEAYEEAVARLTPEQEARYLSRGR